MMEELGRWVGRWVVVSEPQAMYEGLKGAREAVRQKS